MSSVHIPQPKNYNPRLDSLRAIAALAMIPFHWGILQIGWVGVEVFFVLSGMLITESLLKSKGRIADLSAFLGFFFEKRMLRLFPLYYAFLSVMGVVFLMTHYPPFLLAEAPYLLTYTYDLHRMLLPMTSGIGVGHLWSLGVEWQFYLLWPFVVWNFREGLIFRFALALVILAPLLRALTLVAAGHTFSDPIAIGRLVYVAPWTHWDALALGGMLAHPGVRAFLMQTYCWMAAVILAVGSGCLVLHFGRGIVPMGTLGFQQSFPYFYQSVWGYSIVNLLSACLIAATVQRSWITSFTALPFLQYLGKISYGLYVFHFPLIDLGVHFMGPVHRMTGMGVPVLLAIFVIDILLAHLSYRYYESWFLRKKSRLDRNPDFGVSPN